MGNRIALASVGAAILVLAFVLIFGGGPSRNGSPGDLEARIESLEVKMRTPLEGKAGGGDLRGSRETVLPGGDGGAMKARAADPGGAAGGLEDRVTALEDRLGAIEGILRALAESPGGRSRADLASADPAERREGLKALKKRAGDDAEAREAIRRMLDDPDPRVRAEALRSLRGRLDAETLSRVSELLGDPSPEVRREAIKSLSEAGATGSAPAIAGLLADPDSRSARRPPPPLESSAPATMPWRSSGRSTIPSPT